MPIKANKTESVEAYRLRKIAESESNRRKRNAERLRAERRRYRDVTMPHAIPGDRTDNSPALRRDTKVRLRREYSDHPYLTDGRGMLVQRRADGSVDTALTLAVISAYRLILAAGKPTFRGKGVNDAD